MTVCVFRVVISKHDQRFDVSEVGVSVPCPWQSEKCNATGSPHTDLFPMNNDTLQVDIYKGVRLSPPWFCVEINQRR